MLRNGFTINKKIFQVHSLLAHVVRQAEFILPQSYPPPIV